MKKIPFIKYNLAFWSIRSLKKLITGRGHPVVGNRPGKRHRHPPVTSPRQIGNVQRRVESQPRTEFPKHTETVTTIRVSNCPRQQLGHHRNGRLQALRTTCRRSGRTDILVRTPFRIPTCSKNRNSPVIFAESCCLNRTLMLDKRLTVAL
jgi:hypothetical protein